MVDPLGLGLGVFFVLVVVALHYQRGVEWRAGPDVSDAVIEHRAASVVETGFPAPGSRGVGGGGAAGAVEGGEAGAELEGGEATAAEQEAGPWTLPDEDADVFDVEFVKEDATIEVRENETILEAGEDEGWDLPYACREGQCLSCGAHIPDGSADDFVIHHDQEMLSADELDDGYTLTCVAYPTADFSIETRESP